MDAERLLISAIIKGKSHREISDAGITPDFFLDPKTRQVFRDILAHEAKHGSAPTAREMKADYPDLRLLEPEEPLSSLVERVRKDYQLALFEAAISAAVDAYDAGDPEAITAAMTGVLQKVSNEIPVSRDTDITKTVRERLERYEERSEHRGELLGIPTGFAFLDKATLGWQPKQFNCYVGPPKAGKSTTMLLTALEAHKMGHRPLLIGFEMTNEEQEQRIDAILARISHHRLRSGALEPEEKKRLQRALHALEDTEPFILSSDTLSATTVSGVAAKVERYRPDLLLIDGLYMMEDENGEPKGSPQALTNITRSLKRLAQNKEIPVCGSTQVLTWKMDRKRGITDNSIGYSSSFIQDADNIIGVEKTDDPTINKLKIVLSRNAGPGERYIQWDWETGLFQEMDENPFEEQQADYQNGINF